VIIPGTPEVDAVSKAQDSGIWSPRWKGTLALGWKRGALSANVGGRYVSKYQDFDSTREIGNFWFVDASTRFALGDSLIPSNSWFRHSYVEVGAVNLFNRLPEFSNASPGFDPAQADLRGRFLYGQVGVRL